MYKTYTDIKSKNEAFNIIIVKRKLDKEYLIANITLIHVYDIKKILLTELNPGGIDIDDVKIITAIMTKLDAMRDSSYTDIIKLYDDVELFNN